MNAPLRPSAPLPEPALWTVRRRTVPMLTYSARARTAWAAWQAAAPHLDHPAFAEVECELAEEAPTSPTVPSATEAIVAALEKGPAPLATLRTRLAQAGRRRLSTADLLAAVESGAIAFDHLTQRYRRAS